MTGGARCTGWRISHPMSLQASLRSTGCLIASFAAQMTLPAGIIAIAKFALRTLLSSLPRRIPARRNKKAKNKTSSSSLERVLLFGPVPFA